MAWHHRRWYDPGQLGRTLPERIRRLLEEGHFGVKSGQGVFEYPPESVDRRVADRDRSFLKLVKLLSKSP